MENNYVPELVCLFVLHMILFGVVILKAAWSALEGTRFRLMDDSNLGNLTLMLSIMCGIADVFAVCMWIFNNA